MPSVVWGFWLENNSISRLRGTVEVIQDEVVKPTEEGIFDQSPHVSK